MLKNKPLLLLFFLFTAIYCLISLVNHYNFRTFAWDLGITNNAIFDYAHFRFNDCMLLLPFHDHFKNILSDHFTLLPILFSPLQWLFQSYTPLIVQIAAIIAGGAGIYQYALYKSGSKQLGFYASLHFFVIWGIYSALSFDYHDNVIGAMFVPWFILLFEKGKLKAAFLFLILILISKENLALWAIFICLGLVLLNLKKKELVKAGLLFSLLSAVYFILIIKVVMPSLNVETGKEYFHFNFRILGNNFGEALVTLITKPLYCIQVLFSNHLHEPIADDIKTRVYFLLLLSGGLFLVLRPQYLLMLLPIFFQKFFNDDWSKWGPATHYSIEFVPVLSLAALFVISKIKNKILTHVVYILTIGCTIYATHSVLEGYADPYFQKTRVCFYSDDHFTTPYDVGDVYKNLDLIPADAVVSAQSMLVPHLSMREYIYQFPYRTDEVNYIALLRDNNTYPLSKEEYDKSIKELQESKDWKRISESVDIIIFKRIQH